MGEGIRSIFLHGFMSFASVGIIVACLLIMGSFTLLAVNVNEMIAELERQSEILAYVDESLTDEEAVALKDKIDAVGNVLSCEFISRSQAMEDFTGRYEDSSLFDNLDSTVFRHRYKVYLNDISLMSETKANLEEIDGIAKVSAHSEIAEGFITVRNIVAAVSVAIIVILFVVSVFIMSNTVKLTTFDRREEIAIMRMVGATKGFIRWPFVVEGLILGLIGAFAAFFMQWGIYVLLTSRIEGADAIKLIHIVPFTGMAVPVALVFMLTGFLVGVGGSVLAIRKFLRV